MAHIREVMAVGVPSALARMLGSNRVQTVNAGGSSQEDAIPLTVNFALIATGVTGSGVRLGPASGAALTALHNTGPAVANLWPGEDDAFNDQGPNLAVALAPGQTALAVPSVDRWIVAIEGTDAGGGIPEAPSDNNTYGRRNAAWTPALALAGGTMVGTLLLAADPTAASPGTQAATKNYADALAAMGAPLNSPVFTGQPRGTQAPNNDNSTWLATTSYVQAQGFLSQIVLGGDLAGAGGAMLNGTVTGLQGRPVATTAPANGQVLAWSGASNSWAPAPAPPAAAGGATGQLQYNNAGALAGLTMSGDGSLNTATGALTLAAVNSNIGTFQGLTIDNKGRVTAASNMSYGTVTSITAGAGLTGSPGTITGAGTIALATPVSVANGGTGLAGGASGGVPYYSAGTTMASSAQLAANALIVGGGAGAAPATRPQWTLAASGSPLVANFNTVAAPTPAVAGYQVVSSDAGLVPGIQANAFATSPQFRMARADGTGAAPTAVVANDILGDVFLTAWNGAGAYVRAGIWRMIAAENWTTAANGTSAQIITTPIGTTTTVTSQFHANGSLLMPTNVAGGDTGAGSINVSAGYYIGGAAVSDPSWTFSAHNQIGNVSGSAAPPLNGTPGLQIVGATGNNAVVQINTFGQFSSFQAWRADGTPAAPTALAFGDRIGQLAAVGYNGGGSGYSGNVGLIDFVTTQAWTATANGTGIEFRTTANGATVNQPTMGLGLSGLGGLSLPYNVAGGDMGAGTVNAAAGYYLGGAAVSDPDWTFTAGHSHIGNLSGSAAPPMYINNGLQLVGAASAQIGFQSNAFASNSSLLLARADGTPAAPTALAVNDRVAGIYAYGYDGSTYQMTGAITMQASQAYTGSVRGTSMSLWGTPQGGTSLLQLVSIGQVGGGVVVPSSANGGDIGMGTVNVSAGFYIGGVNIMGGRAAVYQGTNYSYTTTATAPGVMLGAGVSNMRITPTLTGRLLVTICGYASNNTATSQVQVALRYGTGTAPAQGAAATGTSPAQCFQTLTSATANAAMPFSLTALITGLTVGTTYWFDLTVNTVISGTANLATAVFNAIEL